MIFWQTILLYLYTIRWINFVCADEKKWTAFQYEGLDELYLQTGVAISADDETNYAILGTLCNKWVADGVFDAVVINGNEFRSRFRGQPAKLENVPQNVLESGSRRYIWVTLEHKFVTDIYTCVHLRDSSHTYAVSRGYERDHLFFLFVFDRDTNVLELKASIMEDLVRLNRDDVNTYLKRREKYYKKVTTKDQTDFAKNPICGLTNADKLRLCMLILGTPFYKTRYEFKANAASVDFQCKEVIVDTGKTGAKIKENTYRCLAKTIREPQTNVSIHISRNYSNYKVNTFTPIAEEKDVEVVKLDTGFKYVFFVEEPYNKDQEMKPTARQHPAAEIDESGTSSTSEIKDGNENNK